MCLASLVLFGCLFLAKSIYMYLTMHQRNHEQGTIKVNDKKYTIKSKYTDP